MMGELAVFFSWYSLLTQKRSVHVVGEDAYDFCC